MSFYFSPFLRACHRHAHTVLYRSGVVRPVKRHLRRKGLDAVGRGMTSLSIFYIFLTQKVPVKFISY